MSRDYCLARLAVALTNLQALRDDVLAVVELFIDPEEDNSGEDRMSILEGCELGLHSVMLAITECKSQLADLEADELAQGEDEVDSDEPDGDEEADADDDGGDLDEE